MSQEPPCKHRTSPIGRKLRSCAACEIEEMHRAPEQTRVTEALRDQLRARVVDDDRQS